MLSIGGCLGYSVAEVVPEWGHRVERGGEVSPDYLASFLDQYLWADEEWLEKTESSATYWQSRLAQQIRCTSLEDGRVHWQINTVVVTDVSDLPAAVQACNALNGWAAGWSFAVEAESRTIHALCSISAPPPWDRYLVRLATAAKLSAWMSDQVAERLAQAVGGSPAFSHPAQQMAPRETPDAVYSMATVIRERPEWVFDPTPHMYPPPEKLADFFTALMHGQADEVDVDDGLIRIITKSGDGRGVSHVVKCGFIRSRIFGPVWMSQVTLPWASGMGSAKVAQNCAWLMFDDTDASLLGAWNAKGDDLAYIQMTLTSELRAVERLDSFIARDETLLWGFVSTLSEAIRTCIQAEATASDTPSAEQNSHQESFSSLAASLHADEAGILVQLPTPMTDHADRRILWMRSLAKLVAWGWFNPMGPSMCTLEICRDASDENSYLVSLLRHPLGPRYIVHSLVKSHEDLVAELPKALEDVLTGSIPDFLSLAWCPKSEYEDVSRLVRERILEVASEHDLDLVNEAARINRNRGRPWDLVNDAGQHPDQIALIENTPDDAADMWLEASSDPAHVDSVLMAFPEPWDAALNYQHSIGNLARGYFDISPLFITYSSIGTVKPGP